MALDGPHHCAPGMLADCPVFIGRPGEVILLEVAERDTNRIRGKVRVPEWPTTADGTKVVLQTPPSVADTVECLALAAGVNDRLLRPISRSAKGGPRRLLAFAAEANQNIVGIALERD